MAQQRAAEMGSQRWMLVPNTASSDDTWDKEEDNDDDNDNDNDDDKEGLRRTVS